MTPTNNFKNIFLIPCWGGKMKENLDKTVLGPVKQATIFPAIPEKTRADLAAIFGENDMAVWGSVDGRQNRAFFGKMRPGDYILFSVNQQVKLVGQIALKTISPELSQMLWPDGEWTFSLIYFIDRTVTVNTPLPKVLTAFGYSEAYRLGGLTAVSEERLQGFYTHYPDIFSLVTDTEL
jgi:hypothetical protein